MNIILLSIFLTCKLFFEKKMFKCGNQGQKKKVNKEGRKEYF